MISLTKRRFKELRTCLRSLESFTDGQARILDYDEETMSEVRFELQPNAGLYEGATYIFVAQMSEEPEISPIVRCITDIYHPNINLYSCLGSMNICLNLFDEWQPDFGLQDVVQGLLFLLHNPEPGDALLDGFDPENYEENVAKHKEGLEIEDWEWGKHRDVKPLPEHVESSDVMAVRVEGLLEKLQEEDATADENDVTAGACAMNESANLNFDSATCVDNADGGATTTSENTSADDEATLSDSTNGVTVSDSTKEMVVSDSVNGMTVSESVNTVTVSDSTNEVTVSNSTNVNNDTDFTNTATNSPDTEQSLPEVNNDIVTDNPDKEAEDDRTSTDSGVDCDTVDTAAGTNDEITPAYRWWNYCQMTM